MKKARVTRNWLHIHIFKGCKEIDAIPYVRLKVDWWYYQVELHIGWLWWTVVIAITWKNEVLPHAEDMEW